MKKGMFLVLGVVMMLGLTSCTKDYTCACTVSGSNVTVVIENAKQGDAEEACDLAETTYKSADANANCTLTQN
jgi:hypothetical protein